ncbi:hypothetical protein pb186bvf_015099 [Paramecium bursaria]
MQNKQFWVFRLMKGRSFIFQIIFVQTLIFLIVISIQVLVSYLIILIVKSLFYEQNFSLIQAKLVEPVINNYNLQIIKYADLEQVIIKQNQNRNILFTNFLLQYQVQGYDYLEECLNQNYSASYQLSHQCAFYYGEDEYLVKQRQIISQFYLLQLFTDQVNENPQYVNFTLENVQDGSVVKLFEKDIENKYEYGSVMIYYNLTQYQLRLCFVNFYTNIYVKQLMASQSNKSIYTLGITQDGFIVYAQNHKTGCNLWDTNCMGFNNQTYEKMVNFIVNHTIQSECGLQLKNILCVKDINDQVYGFYGIIPILNVKGYFVILIRTNIIGEEIDPLKNKLENFYDQKIRQILTRLLVPFLLFAIISLVIFKLRVINKLKRLLIMIQVDIKENQYDRLLFQLKLLKNKNNISQIEKLQLAYYNCVSQKFDSQSFNNNIIKKLLKKQKYQSKDFFFNLERRKFVYYCKTQIKYYISKTQKLI